MNLKQMLYAALFAALIGALGILPPIVLPISPVPITAQTAGVMLAGAVLGAKYGGMSLVVFVSLVAMGVPLLAGGRGGIGVLLGPGGGYILSWPIAAFIIGFLVEKYWHKMNIGRFILFNIVGGIIVVYAGGVTYLSFMTGLPWTTAAFQALIYIPGDLAKAVLAGVIAMQLKKAYPLITKKTKESTLTKVA
ncbi:biotin transporter BioY [Alkalihalophilus lindianensis]|uniref:Biotin transporter n=1 Tax=Alkalihalophilus lindianensis TaxID=1630542 RepID=A0ABU3X4Z5_9BACI|nr:biotin transporter BioY [Alkalihalophilus lindianensis]MDV2682969.1 biotin transporter BioY [Alkalihalophilus lindianensis]